MATKLFFWDRLSPVVDFWMLDTNIRIYNNKKDSNNQTQSEIIFDWNDWHSLTPIITFPYE